MPRGNRGNGEGRISRSGPRGRGRGRGANRGRGRGGVNDLMHNPYEDAMDFVVQKWPENSYPSSPRGGRGRGSNSGFSSPRGNGRRGRGFSQSPRNISDTQTLARESGRGRGRGFSTLPANAPLSKHFFADRPLLKPIVFVRSVYTATLFQEEEEILQSVVEEVDEREESHVPTAERINRVFRGESVGGASPSDDEEELEVFDFHDLARVRAEVDAALPKPPSRTVAEHQFTGYNLNPTPSLPNIIPPVQATQTFQASEDMLSVAEEEPFYVDTTPTPADEVTTLASIESVGVRFNQISISTQSSQADVAVEEPSPFYIDTTPTPVPVEITPSDPPRIPTPPAALPLDDEDIIVYVAPHPRHYTQPSGSVSLPNPDPLLQPAPAPAVLPTPLTHESVSFSFANSPAPKVSARKHAPIFTPRERRRASLRQRLRESRFKKRSHGSFGNYGAIMSEYQLHEGEDPKSEERRRGDSDIDWGDEDDEEGGEAAAEGMLLDDELEFDGKAMQGFVDGMSVKGSQWVGSHDIADAQKIEEEDENEDENGTSEPSEDGDEEELKMEAVFDAEERLLVGEPSESEHSSDPSDDEVDASPRTGFQARLERLRKGARSKKTRDSPPSSEDEDSDDDEFGTWADQDDDLIAEIQDVLDENEAVLTGRDRKQRNRLFRAVRDGDFGDEFDGIMYPARKQKRKGDGLPMALKAQWDKDHLKKAERKRLREQAKLLIASDPLAKKKGGKKGRKAMLAAARLSPTANPITVLPNRIMSMLSLEQQIRRFLQELDGPNEMSLPPMDKATRKQVHEMATAFNLKSQSKGKGSARYTTLIKTTRSGLYINEKKVARLARSGRGWGAPGDWDGRGDKGKGKERVGAAPRHRDGDVIGKAAPKIGQSNIGFQMLASMGWSEGDKIGISGGLDAPLTAIMKNTKLGLGATR